MPLQATSGAASYDAFGGGVAAVTSYIEEVFSTYLYTGTDAALTITNNIDLSTKGGLVWIKNRQQAGYYHVLTDTVRGANKQLYSNTTNAQSTTSLDITSFTTTGFTLGGDNFCNQNNAPNVSWTFRKQPKFFDVVTYTGNGSARTIAHNLGSVPGCIIVKCTSVGYNWMIYHSSLANTQYLNLNNTNPVDTDANLWNSTTPTSSVFSVGASLPTNQNGATYVAYLFAHNAGGFGLTGTDNVISCGSFTTDSGGNATVSLGYEPAWVMFKCSSNAGQNWEMIDTMRGWSMSTDVSLQANSSAAEAPGGYGNPTATGFVMGGQGNTQTYIYIAIRRGPMKVPTSGTSVYNAIARTGTGAAATITGVGFPTDLVLSLTRNFSGTDHLMVDRLRGSSAQLFTNLTAAESTNATSVTSLASNDGISVGTDYPIQSINYASGYTYVTNFFRRAPSFFDEVCYTGTGSDTTQTHNLGVAPELVIIKSRSNAIVWVVGNTAIGFSNYLLLNATDASASGSNVFNSTAPTSTVFSIGAGSGTNQSGATYVAYLFATLAGVSKVGSYTGTATTKQIDCGFTGGARFVLIKRTDSTGDWYVWDSARGIVSGNDSYLLLNSTAAEVTNTDYVDTYSAGFEISSTAPAAINASGGTFVFLAIA